MRNGRAGWEGSWVGMRLGKGACVESDLTTGSLCNPEQSRDLPVPAPSLETKGSFPERSHLVSVRQGAVTEARKHGGKGRKLKCPTVWPSDTSFCLAINHLFNKYVLCETCAR